MRSMSKAVLFTGLTLSAVAGLAQTTAVPPISTEPFDQRSGITIEKQAADYLEQARKRPDGLISTTLERYPGHYTMLTARTKPGGAELHKQWNDFFIVLDGEATELIGGTIENAKEQAGGEVRGTKVVGGTPHIMRKGDVIHIAPGTPHQTVVADGKYFLYYVIKVQAAEQK